MKNQLKNLLSFIPGAAYIKDSAKKVIAYNNDISKIIVKNNECLLNKTDFDFFPLEIASSISKSDDRLLASAPNSIQQQTITFPDEVELIYSSKNVIFNNQNIIVGTFIHTDKNIELLSQKNLLSKQKEQAELTLEQIISLMPGHIYWQDKNGVFLGCNDQQAIDAGLNSRHEIIGKTNADLPWSIQAEYLQANNLFVMETGITQTIEEPCILPDGSTKTYLTKKSPLKDNTGNIIGIVGISFDITAEKETAQLREQKEVAEKQVVLANLISASVAHELRTPLRAISAGVGGINKYLPQLITTYKNAAQHKLDIPFINPAHFKSLIKICDSLEAETKAAFNVIDMLLVKTSHLREMRSSFNETSIHHCVREMLHRYPFEGEDAKLITFDEQNDFMLYGDDLLITHVLFNLLKNAIYYVRAADKGAIHLWTELGKDYNRLHFKDTGLGISEKNLTQIFERFFTTSAHGTGVGLAFCEMVMKEIGGDIRCFSKEGEFTEFVLSFPVLKK